ncbi:MAG: hypothetical protein ACRD1X_14380 [Vicinamibacteria bacterium]
MNLLKDFPQRLWQLRDPVTVSDQELAVGVRLSLAREEHVLRESTDLTV